jgi:Helix-turn-helix domain
MSDKRASQADRILKLLQYYSCGQEASPLRQNYSWVSLTLIMQLGIASHTRRIHELRKAGHVIELRDKWVNGQRRTAYRLVKS